MTPEEAAAFIVFYWREEYAPAAIMIMLIVRGVPCEGGWTLAKVHAVIRRYVECNSENGTYRAKAG